MPDFRAPHFQPFSKAWYTHKFNGPGVRYEIAVCILTGWIVWLNGPYPCGDWPDINIFRAALKHELGHGERAEADDGYIGEYPATIRIPASEDDFVDPVFERMRGRVRKRQESVNRRFKHWKCLKEVFHHSDDYAVKQSDCFRAVCVITQLEIENGHPLFQADYDDSLE